MHHITSRKNVRLAVQYGLVLLFLLIPASSARKVAAVQPPDQPERRTVLVPWEKIYGAQVTGGKRPLIAPDGSQYLAMSYEVPTPSYGAVSSGLAAPTASSTVGLRTTGSEPLSPADPQGFFLGVDFDDNPTHNSGAVFIPPDPHAAAGPNQLVSVVNTMIAWYNKDGSSPSVQALSAFFSSLTPATSTFDPKVIYDQYNNRFVVITLERTSSPSQTSRIFLAVSDDNNPNGTWHFQQINSLLNIAGVNTWADYPGFAVDPNAIYIALNMFDFGNTSRGSRLWIVDKGDGSGGLYDGGTSTVTVHNPYTTSAIPTTHQPAHTFGTLPGNTGTFLVAHSGLSDGVNEYLQVIRVDDPIGTPAFAHQFVQMGNIDNPLSALPDAPQQGTATLIEVNDRRALNAVWRNNALYMSTTIAPNSGPDAGQTTAYWVQLDTTNLAALTVSQQAGVGGEDIASGTYTFFPSIMVDNFGNVGIGFSASAATIYSGAYFTRQYVNDAAGTNRSSETVRAGQDYYIRIFAAAGGTNNRWGDYSGVALDPVDGTFWVYNEYAMTRGTSIGGEDGRWATAFGNFSVLDYGDAPDPTYPTLLANDGARHIMDGVTYLGATLDEDLDGQPNATATGDDGDGTDDEDGVLFSSALRQGISATLQITASVGGVLNGWIDFDADGDWSDAGEQVFTDLALSAGGNSLSFTVPAGASVGQTYARFRFSTLSGLMPTGLASDGEVEDYQINIEGTPNVTIAKTVQPQVNVARQGTVTYTIVLSNTGTADDTNTLLTDTLPSNVEFGGWVERPSGASVSNDEITWNGTVTNGVTVTFTLTATHVGAYGETVTNTARFSGTLQTGSDDAVFAVVAAPPEPPPLVHPADGTVTNTTPLTLTWSPVANATGYLLDWNGTVSDVGNLTERGTGVLADGTYTWTVAAYDVLSRTSAYTDIWTFEVDTVPPAAPALLGPSDGMVTSTAELTLTWNAVSDATGYRLDFNGQGMDVGNTTAYGTGVLANKTYTWTVAAYDAASNTGAYASAWSFTVQVYRVFVPLLLKNH